MISKYVLMILVALVMQGTVKACSDDGATQQKAAESHDLSERLAKSEYVVEKGKLARRQGAGEPQAATTLGRDEELRVMEKSLDAAKAKLSIPEGSGVIVVEGKEFYEVVIGNPPAREAGGDEYTAKVLVDKKSLAVAQVESKEMRNSDEAIARKMAEFRDLSERLANSEYVVEKGKLSRRAQGKSGTSTSLSHDEEFNVMEKALDAAKAALSIPEGASVVIAEGEKYYEVVIGNPPSAGVRGPDYTAKVFVDKKTLAIARILSGG